MKKIILLSLLLVLLVGCTQVTQQQTVILGNQSSVSETKVIVVYETDVKEETPQEKTVQECTDFGGIVTIGKESYADACVGGILIDYYCDGNYKTYRQIRCSNGCKNGRCNIEVGEEEPNPPKPTTSIPITFSRNPIITHSGDLETIKISILNPTSKDWDRAELYVKHGVTLFENFIDKRSIGDIKAGNYITYNLDLKIKGGISKGNYILQIFVLSEETTYIKDLIVRVI